MSNPVNWFHITTKDVEGLGKFYTEAFDWKVKPGPGGMLFADTGKGGIPGGIAAPMPGDETSAIHIYIGTKNIDESLARVEAHGGRPAMPKMELPDNMGWIAGFIDPAGHFVGLWQQGAPAPKARRAAKKAAKSAKKATKKAAKATKKAAKKAAKKR